MLDHCSQIRAGFGACSQQYKCDTVTQYCQVAVQWGLQHVRFTCMPQCTFARCWFELVLSAATACAAADLHCHCHLFVAPLPWCSMS
jgi:hypothetical protein